MRRKPGQSQEEAAAGLRFGASEPLGDIGVCQTVDVDHADDRAIRFRELVEAGSKTADVLAHHRFAAWRTQGPD